MVSGWLNVLHFSSFGTLGFAKSLNIRSCVNTTNTRVLLRWKTICVCVVILRLALICLETVQNVAVPSVHQCQCLPLSWPIAGQYLRQKPIPAPPARPEPVFKAAVSSLSLWALGPHHPGLSTLHSEPHRGAGSDINSDAQCVIICPENCLNDS